MVSVVNPIGNNDIDGILWGWKWDSTNITFSFPTGTAEYSGYEEINGFQAFNATQQTAVRNILANVASFTNLTFTETTADGAILRYAEADSINYTDDSNVAGHDGLHTIDTAEANPPELSFGGDPPFAAPYAQGDSWYNHTSYNNAVPGSFAYAAGIMHETGHNLGLKHGHNTQEGHGIIFPELPADHNSYEYSVMTYQQFPGDTGSGDNAPDHPTTFMQNDIAALQYMYGANYNFNSGNTTYTWSTTTGQSFVNGVGGLTPDANFILMTIWDGGGFDTYDFSNYSTDIVVDLSPGGWVDLNAQIANLGDNGAGGPTYFARGNIASAQVDPNNPTETASYIERAIGGTGDDQINGNSVDNTLKGGGGDDSLSGLQGDDWLQGDAGNDSLKGAGGADNLFGGENDDELKGGGGADYLSGGDGIDTASYNLSTSGVTVDLGNDTASGGEATGDSLDGIENLTGSDHNDGLSGDANVNALYGGEGDDLLKGAGGADGLDGGIDNDTASYYYSLAGVTVSLVSGTGIGGDAEGDTLDRIENLWGSNYNDFLTGDGNANSMLGWNGDDVMKGGGGADSLDGGLNTDTASYLDSNAGVSVSLATGNGFFGYAAGDSLDGFENLTGSGYGDSLYGDSGGNSIKGAGGADYLFGDDGNDSLAGNADGDTIDGWNGIDAADYSGSDAGVDVNLLAGTASGGDATGDSLFRIENLIGSGYADTLTGDGGVNVLNGGDAGDTMVGGGGADTLDGGTGGDNMAGGAQNDIYYTDNAADIISELLGEGYDTINTTLLAVTLGANMERVNYTGAGNFVGTGNALSNRFQSLGGADRFVDVTGGADIFSGGAGTDTMDYRTAATGVILNFITDVHGGSAAGDSFSAMEKYLGCNTANDMMTAGGIGRFVFAGGGGNDTLIGGIKNDQLIGQAGVDTLVGGADKDSLQGGANNDTMTGGTQADVFVYSDQDAAFGRDTITDYEDGVDSFKMHSNVANDVSDFSISGNGTTSVLLTLIAGPTHSILIQGVAPITITNSDFTFY